MATRAQPRLHNHRAGTASGERKELEGLGREISETDRVAVAVSRCGPVVGLFINIGDLQRGAAVSHSNV